MKRNHAMRAARAAKARKEWTRKNAGLFHEPVSLEERLKRSLDQMKRTLLQREIERATVEQEDGRPFMHNLTLADMIELEAALNAESPSITGREWLDGRRE